MSLRPRVALLIESSRAYGRGLLRGIARYLKASGSWSVQLQERDLGDSPPGWLHGWRGDGIIARVETECIERAILETRLPAVDLRGLRRMNIPLIGTHDDSVVRLAIEHLRERGFRQFAFCGFAGADYSERRLECFKRRVLELGAEVLAYQSPPPKRGVVDTMRIEQSGFRHNAKMGDWLRKLPKPIGLFACNDIRAQQVLNACRQKEVSVPDEIAVVGVDNDELLCELSDPPLSSVEPDTMQIGYDAAALLDRMMSGEPAPKDTVYVDALRVVTRSSTDIQSIADPLVAEAVRIIRHRAIEPLSVDKLIDTLRVSLSSLERRFHEHLGRTPKTEILRVQLNRVKELLAETDLPLVQIAAKSGFTHAEHLSSLFKLKTGQTPGEFRTAAHHRMQSQFTRRLLAPEFNRD